MKKQQLIADKIWRLVKVIYFIVTVPMVIIGCFLLFLDTYISSEQYIRNEYLGTIYCLIFVLWYILLTDFLRRIIQYITNGDFTWAISYKRLFTQNKEKTTKYITFFLLCIWVLLIWSYRAEHFCSWENEIRNWDSCDCYKWYNYEGWVCMPSLETTIRNALPAGVFLRDIQLVAWIENVYLWIYIKNYKMDELSEEIDVPYTDCHWEVRGQWIEGEYHIFTYAGNKITSDLQIPLWFRNEGINPELAWQLVFSYMNTNHNNYMFFNWKESKNNSNTLNEIEVSKLINLSDYNWDGIKNEFYLVDHWDQVCGHNNYLIAGYDVTSSKAIIYWIKWKDNTISYWADNFKPDEKWEVKNGWECWDHGSWIESENYYKFNKESNIFELTQSTQKDCPEWAY